MIFPRTYTGSLITLSYNYGARSYTLCKLLVATKIENPLPYIGQVPWKKMKLHAAFITLLSVPLLAP